MKKKYTDYSSAEDWNDAISGILKQWTWAGSSGGTASNIPSSEELRLRGELARITKENSELKERVKRLEELLID